MEMSDNLIPSHSELAARSLFGATQRERELAKRLLANTLESKNDEHPWLTLERLYPPGSEAEKAMMQSPVGQIVQQIIDAQPLENQPEDYIAEFSEAFEEAITTKPTLPPSPPAMTKEIEDLAARTSLSNTIRSHGSEGPVIKPQKVQLPDSDWGPGFSALV
jgi:hypothetical protein